MEKINAKYGDVFSSLDIEVGFARFLRVLMGFEAQTMIEKDHLKHILPNSSTNESMRLFLQNLSEAQS